jgi:hypothetical protein
VSRAIGTTGATAPADLSLAVGQGYADVVVAGKRYSLGSDCPACIGTYVLRAKRLDDASWRTFDLAEEGRVDTLRAYLAGLPAGSVALFVAPGRVTLPPDLFPILQEFGAPARAQPTGAAYLLLGVHGAPADSAIEASCTEGCWRYVGEPWPARRLAVESVELTP